MAGLLIANGSGPPPGNGSEGDTQRGCGVGPEGTTGNSVRVADAIQ